MPKLLRDSSLLEWFYQRINGVAALNAETRTAFPRNYSRNQKGASPDERVTILSAEKLLPRIIGYDFSFHADRTSN